MTNYASITILTVALTACDGKLADKVVPLSQDTSNANSSLTMTNSIYENPFRDINNFDPVVGDSVIDELHRQLSMDSQTNVNIKRDICARDNCTSFKTFKNGNTTLHLFKSDGGEYGFSNDQFLLSRDSLSIARNFYVGVETWPTDSTGTVWSCTEQVFYFYKDYVKILERKVLTKDLFTFDFSLKNVEFKIQSPRGTNLYEEKYDELTGLLAAKDNVE